MQMPYRKLFDYITGLEEVVENFTDEGLELVFKGVGINPLEVAVGLYNILPVYWIPQLVGKTICKLEGELVKGYPVVFKFTIVDTYKN